MVRREHLLGGGEPLENLPHGVADVACEYVGRGLGTNERFDRTTAGGVELLHPLFQAVRDERFVEPDHRGAI